MKRNRFDSRAKKEIPPELEELRRLVYELPNNYREPLLRELRLLESSIAKRRNILLLVKNVLSNVRLDMKYLLFDLEATRRERDEYKEQLEE